MKKILFLFLIIPAIAFGQKDIPDPMNPPRLVNDFANILSEGEESALEQKLQGYEDTTTTQMVVVTVPSLSDYEIEDYANRLFNKWEIGTKDKDNGLLILIAPNDRRLRIEVGYGLEGRIPDLFAHDVQETVLIPAIKEGNYYKGLNESINVFIAQAAGEYEGTPKKSKKGPGTLFWIILIIIILISIFGGGRGRRGSTFSSRGMGSGWGGSFGGGSWGGSSGGFGGFGGGGSGGGGSSGRW